MDSSQVQKDRVLLLTGPNGTSAPPLDSLDFDLVEVHDFREALLRLRAETFQGLFISSSNKSFWRDALGLLEEASTFDFIGDGFAIVRSDLRIAWANQPFRNWCRIDPIESLLHQVFPYDHEPPDLSILLTALQGQPVSTQLQLTEQRFLSLRIQPMLDKNHKVLHLVVLAQDMTQEMLQQKKIDTIHQAANELAKIDTTNLEDMSPEERTEFLKVNISRLTHDLLQYDVIEIRLLDSKTKELKQLLAEGMTPEAAARILFAATCGNGVTGYVAATGQTYVCNDTSHDPHYIEGALGARSSLTIALKQGERIIGTFNVESPKPHAFGPRDVQFAEMFCREVASALHTLDLLTMEKNVGVSRSIEAINRDVNLPVDEILTAAMTIKERWLGHVPEVVDRLDKIVANARVIRESIHRVGEDAAQGARPLTFQGAERDPNKLNLRVLVVDNERRTRQQAHSILGRLGCTVETAQDGQEAITMAKLAKYDAIVADIRLPDMTGYDVYTALRKAQPGSHVILMTGYGYDPTHTLVRAKQDGLRFMLCKPFNVAQLLTALRAGPNP